MRREFVFGTFLGVLGRWILCAGVVFRPFFFVWGPRRKVDFVRRRVSPVFFFVSGLFFGNAEVVINDKNQARFAYCFMHRFFTSLSIFAWLFLFFLRRKKHKICGFFAGFPPGWLAGWLGNRGHESRGHCFVLGAPWKSDPVAILVAAVLRPSLGCASEGGFCARVRVPGDLRAYWVRLGIQILSLFW